MTIDELLEMEPTLSEYSSQKLVLEIFHKDEWRCYAVNTSNESEALAERFLKHHARIPGLISRELYAHKPAAVFHFSSGEGESAKGGLFYNGAVLISNEDGKRSVSLFIDEATAQRLSYPDTGFVYLSQIESEEDI